MGLKIYFILKFNMFVLKKIILYSWPLRKFSASFAAAHFSRHVNAPCYVLEDILNRQSRSHYLHTLEVLQGCNVVYDKVRYIYELFISQ